MSTISPPSPSRGCLPCAVQIGFSGTRDLFAPDIEQQIVDEFVRVLASLPSELKLAPGHILAGISQIAIGGDMHFTRACADPRSGVALQRIFLAQPIDAYLSAMGSQGPDFSTEQKKAAEELLKLPHIAHIQCVTNSDDRRERFSEAASAILDECDIAIGLLGPDPKNKKGGTQEFLDFAAARGKPALKIEISLQAGRAILTSTWSQHKTTFVPPTLPSVLDELACPVGTHPDHASVLQVLRDHFSPKADLHRQHFEKAAIQIIATHVGATLCATLALAFIFLHAKLWPLLTLELILLVWGFIVHHRLNHEPDPRRQEGTDAHAARKAKEWADDRIGAEVVRCLHQLSETHVHVAPLFRLRLAQDRAWRSFLTTLNLLHLAATRHHKSASLEDQRGRYVANRLDELNKGQVEYYRKTAETAQRQLRLFNRAFHLCVGLAMASTAIKLSTLFGEPHGFEPDYPALVLGTLAVVLPVFAVGFLSWANAIDCQARATMHTDMENFLKRQREAVLASKTLREFRRRVIETEYGLFSEYSEWYARRVVTTVS